MKFQSVPSWTLKITHHSGSKIYLNYIIVWIVLWDALNAGHCKQPPCEKIRRETAINLHGVLHGVQSKAVGGTRGRRISASKQIQWSDIVSWYKQIELWSGVCSVYLKLFKHMNIALGCIGELIFFHPLILFDPFGIWGQARWELDCFQFGVYILEPSPRGRITNHPKLPGSKIWVRVWNRFGVLKFQALSPGSKKRQGWKIQVHWSDDLAAAFTAFMK